MSYTASIVVIFDVSSKGPHILYGIVCHYLHDGYLFHSIQHVLVNQGYTDGREEEEEEAATMPREKQKGKKGELNNIHIVFLPFQIIR